MLHIINEAFFIFYQVLSGIRCPAIAPCQGNSFSAYFYSVTYRCESFFNRKWH